METGIFEEAVAGNPFQFRKMQKHELQLDFSHFIKADFLKLAPAPSSPKNLMEFHLRLLRKSSSWLANLCSFRDFFSHCHSARKKRYAFTLRKICDEN